MEVSELVKLSVEEQFLRFTIAPNTKGLMSISQMSEVLTINFGQILRMPHMNPWVMGAYNWRGAIIWMLDLGQLLGLPPLHQQETARSSYKAIVMYLPLQSDRCDLSADRRALGLVVSQIEDIEWCNPALIQEAPPSCIGNKLMPFLRGYYLSTDGEALAVFEGESILAAMPK
ncbi:MAG: chemotaxis protein CheW [Xenococcaceae cyanobacterium]